MNSRRPSALINNYHIRAQNPMKRNCKKWSDSLYYVPCCQLPDGYSNYYKDDTVASIRTNVQTTAIIVGMDGSQYKMHIIISITLNGKFALSYVNIM